MTNVITYNIFWLIRAQLGLWKLAKEVYVPHSKSQFDKTQPKGVPVLLVVCS